MVGSFIHGHDMRGFLSSSAHGRFSHRVPVVGYASGFLWPGLRTVLLPVYVIHIIVGARYAVLS